MDIEKIAPIYNSLEPFEEKKISDSLAVKRRHNTLLVAEKLGINFYFTLYGINLLIGYTYVIGSHENRPRDKDSFKLLECIGYSSKF
tara:strand:- start:145 stop:405 length:261 start_codon:yes stop_codon:yes gene_type:complete